MTQNNERPGFNNPSLRIPAGYDYIPAAMAQTSTGPVHFSRPARMILPDGRVLSPDKLDSLYQVWGQGRVSLVHSMEMMKRGSCM